MAIRRGFLLAILLTLCLSATSSEANKLKVGFYSKTCPRAEEIIREEMIKAIRNDSDTAAGILRLHFHDCFVRGCDGSALLDPTPMNNATEMTAVFSRSLHGYEVIDRIKARLEAVCRETVSCADALAFAARESVALSGGHYYQVPAGRRDGSISIADETTDVPRPILDINPLIASFAKKGLSVEDMVVLSGSHTIGLVHCGTLTVTRLYNFSQNAETDPTLDPKYAAHLRNTCPQNGSIFVTLPMDPPTPFLFDNSYYKLLLRNLGVLHTDQALMASPVTAAMVKQFAANNELFQQKFAAAMVKMGKIEVLTGKEGKIHTNCRRIN